MLNVWQKAKMGERMEKLKDKKYFSLPHLYLVGRVEKWRDWKFFLFGWDEKLEDWK